MKESLILARAYIKELKVPQTLEGVYAVQNCQLGQTKTGKPFIKCLLADKTGRTPGRMWNASEELFATLPTDGFVWVEGQTQPYQGEVQIIIQRIEPYTPTQRELTELLPSTKHDVNQMFREVMQLLGSLEHPAIKALADRYLEDGELMDAFCQAPAAQSLHHAYLGGLLEHTLSLMQLAERMLPHYPQLNRDIVVFGLFLHDLGKTRELVWEQGFGYSPDGQLIGHIARGSIWLEQKAMACEQLDPPVAIPEPILGVLQHIILSHHGVPEYGAAKIPATPEALFVSMLDNLDAKMNICLTVSRDDEETPVGAEAPGDFSEKIWALNNVRLFRPDPTQLPDGEA